MTLIKPLITEKSIRETAGGIFTFEVARFASKSQIKATVESLFKVKVTKVTTRVSHLAPKRTGSKRTLGLPGITKFASIHLIKGQSIALFDLKEEKK